MKKHSSVIRGRIYRGADEGESAGLDHLVQD